MRERLQSLLVNPESRTPLRLISEEVAGDETVTGRLVGESGESFPVTAGIPRFVRTEDPGQQQTGDSFGFKWGRRDSYNSPGMQQTSRQWLTSRYGFATVEDMRDYFGRAGRFLDAGCGGGFSAALWLAPDWKGACWVGADISSAIDVARDRLGHVPNTHFVQADLMKLPFAPGSFDVIFSEGVLHHTPSTEAAFKTLVQLLKPGGELLCYIYRRKGPVREFTDDHIRNIVASMPPEQAWRALEPLTHLARALAELKADVDVPADIPYLEIKAGRYDVQRLIYWHFAKLFWNENYTFDENVHINFDWYHPTYAHRHSEEDMRSWCDESGLIINRLQIEEAGMTVRAVKR